MAVKRLQEKPTNGQASTAFVPDMEIAENYVVRTHGKGRKARTDFDLFDFALLTQNNILIEGPTGTGKTMCSMAYAAQREMPFYAVSSNVSVDPSQLFGKILPMPNGTFEWVDGPVTQIVRDGGVLLINEVNFMPPRIATVLFSLLDARRCLTLLDHYGEVVHAHKDLLIVGDMNPNYHGTMELNQAFRNRFGLQLVFDYDETIERELLKSMALMTMAKALRGNSQNRTPISTRTLMLFELMVANFGMDIATTNFINQFPVASRAGIRQVVKTYEGELSEELELDSDGYSKLDRARRAMKPGDRDKYLGVLGTDWELSTEGE